MHRDKTFDIITCLDLLEHVPNAHEVILEMRRLLKDNGKIIIMVPALRMLWSQHDEALSHYRRYEKGSLLHEVSEAHLKVEKINFFFFTSFFAVFPIRIIRRFLPPKARAKSDTTTLPPAFLNAFLKFIFEIEMKVADKINLPFGTTLYAVVSKEGK
jgi:SAM-dependent methyltransferase